MQLTFWLRLWAYPGLHGIGGKENRSLRGAVNVHVKNRLLDLQEEEVLRDLLNKLFRNVLREKLGQENQG